MKHFPKSSIPRLHEMRIGVTEKLSTSIAEARRKEADRFLKDVISQIELASSRGTSFSAAILQTTQLVYGADVLAFVSNKESQSQLEEENPAEQLVDRLLESVDAKSVCIKSGETFTSTIWLPPGGVVLWQVPFQYI